MKVKTNFKNMYLIDSRLYNIINREHLSSNVISRSNANNKFNPTIHVNQMQPFYSSPNDNNKPDVKEDESAKVMNDDTGENGESKMDYHENKDSHEINSFNQENPNESKNTSLSNHSLQGNLNSNLSEPTFKPETNFDRTKLVESPSILQLKKNYNADNNPCVECDDKQQSSYSNIDANSLSEPLKHTVENDNIQMEVDNNNYKTNSTDVNQINEYPLILKSNENNNEIHPTIRSVHQFPREPSQMETNQSNVLSKYPLRNNTGGVLNKRRNKKKSSSLRYEEPMKIDFKKSDNQPPLLNQTTNFTPSLESSTNNQSRLNYQHQKELEFSKTVKKPSLQLNYIPPQYLSYQEPPKLNFPTNSDKLIEKLDENVNRAVTQKKELGFNKTAKNPSLQLNYIPPQYLSYEEPSKLNLPINSDENLNRAVTLKSNMKPATLNNSKKREIEYDEKYPLIPQNIKVTYTCTICNTNFQKKSTLLRHNKNVHDSFYQLDKGDKRKLEEVYFIPNKKIKNNLKRKSVGSVSNLPKKTRGLEHYVS